MGTGNKQDYLLNEVVPLYGLHPGGTLREELRERKIKHKDFAHSVGMQPSHLSALINGARNITPAIAAKLEKGLGIPATFWVNLQNNYNLDIKRIKERSAAVNKENSDGQVPVKPYPVKQYPLRALADPTGSTCYSKSAACAFPPYKKIMLTIDAADMEWLELLANRMGWELQVL
ncbi:MAG: HigA family addiction module antidote protein [Bacteroidales bacterium]|nr:HigA family addiction module antidote protein [Bacteroidales bacterium]